VLLVTGACGYIGSHFVRYYLDNYPDRQVIAVDNLSEGHRQAISGKHEARIRFYQTNIGDRQAMSRIMSEHQVEGVVHFAASAYVGESQEVPFKYFDNNVGNTTGLLAAMDEASVKRLVFSSTCATYGNPEYSPLDEKHRQKPINTYGVTKYMVEEMLRALALCKNLRFVALRYFNASGACPSGDIGESHDPETHLLPLAIKAALGKSEGLRVFGNDYDTPDGTCVRDYIHVNDLAAAHCQALELIGGSDFKGDMVQSNDHGMAINLGTSHGASVKEVIAGVEAVTGKPVPHKFEARRPGDPAHLVANSAKAKAILGWEPKHDLKSIIESAAHWEANRRY